MKLKLNENLPHRVGRLLADHGHEAITVAQEGLGGKSDATVARAAAQEGRMVVTLDRRFADIRRHPPGRHPGFLVLRTHDQSAPAVARLLGSLLAQYELESLAGCIVVLEPGAVRVRRPR